jgi:hypothetical protein
MGMTQHLTSMRQVVSHARAGRAQTIYRTITVELSTMTFEDLMSFVGADEYAYAA